ncbi:Modification methylase BanI [Pseudovibrio axinellae]|uniref:Cytosine-specific methyltransferase n=1 Tax=Pseudovibrio axinellae TaxID=989403 RepID=A0A165SWI7_9HYPH|nr:DNA cytosine methyltransferase [Pseudovibrio axinellae]KZL04571.1 Modification methylase BanI [Pseudovibrio axinellae]SEQ72668.1 DNA (cytosine-5)-methyltransferase 1 [Pseudovibrio axinellae]
MRFLSVCSGIEAASVAWKPLGWEPIAFSEIEPFPCAVLKHHYPDVPNLGDMTKFEEWPDLGPVDLVCGGTPCQAFSVAGLRKGLADPRGNLTLSFLAIVNRYRPRWVVWENVPGVLSSWSGDAPPGDLEEGEEWEATETSDFGSFLGALGQLGYGWSYRVLDAQYCRVDGYPHAVPQRRRRVFLVGYFGDWRYPAAVLSEPQSLLGNSPPRREAGKATSRGIEFGPQGGGFAEVSPTLDTRAKDGPIRNQLAGAVLECAEVAPTLNAHFGTKQGLENQHINSGCGLFVSHTLLAKPNSSLAADLETYVAHTLQGEGFDASEDGTGRRTPIVPIAFDCKGTEVQYIEDGSHPTLRSMGHNKSHQNAGGHAAVCQHQAARRLTPTECERLMGFPDNYTRIPYRNKPADMCPDGPRYKSNGNSWPGNVATWVGKRIQLVEEVAQEIEQARFVA